MMLARVVERTERSSLELAAARAGVPVSMLEAVDSASLLLTGLHAEAARALGDAVAQSGGAASLVPGAERDRPGTAIVVAPVRVLERIAREAGPEVGTALRRALSAQAPASLRIGEREIALGGRVALMAVVNVTPDSFSDGGRFLDPEGAVAHGVALAEAGAEILDVGGESTRPGSAPVDPAEEIRRVVPVIHDLRERTSAVVSVDTRKAEVARAALGAGAALVNDVSGGLFDPALLDAAAERGAALCLMHIRGTPETMQDDPRYSDVVEEVLEFLSGAVERAVAAGCRRERILVDPGIGFGKTYAHNHFLLRRLADLRALGQPLAVGFSRKAFLGALTGGRPAGERVLATAACAAAVAMTGGADVLRVHDVAEVREALAVAHALRTARDGGALFAPGG